MFYMFRILDFVVLYLLLEPNELFEWGNVWNENMTLPLAQTQIEAHLSQLQKNVHIIISIYYH